MVLHAGFGEGLMWRDVRRFFRDVLCTLSLGLLVLTCFLWWRSYRIADAAEFPSSERTWWPAAVASNPGWIDARFRSEERVDHAGVVVDGIVYSDVRFLQYFLHHAEWPGGDFDGVATLLRQQMSGRHGPPRFGIAATRYLLIRSNPSPSWPTRVVEWRWAVRYWVLAIVLVAPPASVLVRAVRVLRLRSRGTPGPRTLLRQLSSGLAQTGRAVALAVLLALLVLWSRSILVADEFSRGASGIVTSPDGKSHWESFGYYAELCGGVFTLGRRVYTSADPPGPDFPTFAGSQYIYTDADQRIRYSAAKPPDKTWVDACGLRVIHAVIPNVRQYYFNSATVAVPYPVNASAWIVRIPLWLPTVLLAVVPVVMIARHRQRARARSRALAGLCPHCGYDLRESTGRCPECGAERPRDEGAEGEPEAVLTTGGSPAAT